MPEEQDDTILLFANSEENLPKNLSPHDGFEVRLESRCGSYYLVTSSKNLTYRVEVFESEVLIDAIESTCKDLRQNVEALSLFEKRYVSAHEKFKQKLCLEKKNSTPVESQNQKSLAKKQLREPAQKSQAFNPVMHDAKHVSNDEALATHTFRYYWENFKGYVHALGEKQGFKLAMVLVSVVLTVLVVGRVLMCQEGLLDLFLDKEEKVAYYIQTESLCHKLEEGCLNLSKEKSVDDALFTAQKCLDYCQEGDMTFEVCETFAETFKVKPLAHKPQEEKKTIVAEKLLPKDAIVVNVEDKVLFSHDGAFELTVGKAYVLALENPSLKACTVEVQNLVVLESEHDEIVQLSEGVSHLTLAPKETKSFTLFLEESYYRQFSKGKYTGQISLAVVYADTPKATLSKSFFFEVD